MNNINNNTTNTNTNNTSREGGSDIGGLTRQLLGQQAEVLAKLDVLIENQDRLEKALQASQLANSSASTINSSSSSAARSASNASV